MRSGRSGASAAGKGSARPAPGPGGHPEFTDRPSAYIPGDRRRALALGQELPTLATGAALFADISGFTPLSEGLVDELGSHRASELLTSHLNRVFHEVISELDRYGGEVIYFSGDAITCWLDGDGGARAVASGLGMQEAMRRDGEIETPGGQRFRLGLKVATAVGSAHRFVVGDPEIQLIDVLAGGLIDRLAATEHLAEEGELVVDLTTLDSLSDRLAVVETRTSDEAGVVGVVDAMEGDEPDQVGIDPVYDDLPDALARPWLLPAVYERMSTGRGEFLAELRPALPMFLSFGGIDYDHDPAASDKLDEFVRAAQRVFAGNGGNVLQLTLGDKGAYLYGVFGTPLAHEDDAERAAATALELQALGQSTAAREIRIGITHGRLRSGTYGHDRRRTFVCLGDAVNLSARLMSRAPAGTTYVSELVRRSAGEGFAWNHLEPMRLKGKAAPVEAFELTGLADRRSRRAVRHRMAMVGRAAELKALEARLTDAAAGQGGIVGLSAEAGMGKSRLVAEFVRRARRRDTLVAYGECQSFGANVGYAVWREIWRTLLGVDEHASADVQAASAQRALREIGSELVERAPLLDAVLGLSLPDTDLTASFDPKLRKTSLENLLADCLRARAAREPLVLVLEDCHWLDALSRDLLEVLARAAGSAAVLLVLAYRPEAALPEGLGLGRLHGLEEIRLEALDEAGMRAVVGAKRREQVGDSREIAPVLLELVLARAQGNPFYAEELLNYVFAQGIDATDARAVRSLELPTGLHSLVLSHIDALSESPRRTLKVASVVGRAFRVAMLHGVYPDLGELGDVRAHLGTLSLLDLVVPDRDEDESFLFKHAVTHDVAYESLPYALRATLHAHVGRYLESRGPETIDQSLDLLAHHYWHSDENEKKQWYLRRAGDAARANYANAAAISYYERLAPLLDEAARVEALLDLGAVLELVGEWDRARVTDEDALELAGRVGDPKGQARCETALAEVARKQGRFDEAAERLGRADGAFALLGEEAGRARVAHLAGTLAAQRGDYDSARERYEFSLAIRRRLDDRAMMASLLSNLGVVAEYAADYPLSRSYHEQALDLRTDIGDRWAIGVSMTNLGMIALLEGSLEEARDRFEEAIRLNREVGDSWMVAVSENNLGNADRDLGDLSGAAEHYRQSLAAYRDYGDRWSAAFLLEDVGLLAARCDAPEAALRLIGAADTLREEIGAARAGSVEKGIADVVAPATAFLDPERREAVRNEGRGLGFDAGIEAALRLLDEVGATRVESQA